MLALMNTGCRLESSELPSSDDFARLLGLAKAGDASAFERIMVAHERRVLMTALRLLGRLEDAQDAAQEVFLRLYKYLRRFDDGRELAPWLYRMTVNVCHDLRSKRPATLSLEEAPEAVDTGTDLVSALTRGQERDMIAQGLRTLPEKERSALVLRDIEGLSTQEVAYILGSSEGTVRSQISAARCKIKKFTERFQKRHL